MQVVVLGSGCALPSPTRGSAGYLVRAGETVMLLDCGSGTLQRMARAGVFLPDLAGIFLSHIHPDHMGDLPALLFSARVAEIPLREGLRVHAGPGVEPYVREVLQPYGHWVQPSDTPIEIVEHDGSTFEVGELLCRVRPVEHHATSLGIQVTSPDGCRVAYLGDTDLCDEAVELCRGVDLAIVECSLPDEEESSGHMSPRKVAELGKAAQPGGLLLTHIYPQTDRLDLPALIASHGCDVPAVVARDGMGVAIDDPEADG